MQTVDALQQAEKHSPLSRVAPVPSHIHVRNSGAASPPQVLETSSSRHALHFGRLVSSAHRKTVFSARIGSRPTRITDKSARESCIIKKGWAVRKIEKYLSWKLTYMLDASNQLILMFYSFDRALLIMHRAKTGLTPEVLDLQMRWFLRLLICAGTKSLPLWRPGNLD